MLSASLLELGAASVVDLPLPRPLVTALVVSSSGMGVVLRFRLLQWKQKKIYRTVGPLSRCTT